MSGVFTCLGTKSDADHARGDTPQNGNRRSNFSGHGTESFALLPITRPITRFWIRTWRRWVNRVGKLTPALHILKVVRCRRPSLERGRQDVGRGDRVLDGQVDADASDRGHRVGRIADAEEAGPVPGLERSTVTVKSLISSQALSSPTRSCMTARSPRYSRGTTRCPFDAARRGRPWG